MLRCASEVSGAQMQSSVLAFQQANSFKKKNMSARSLLLFVVTQSILNYVSFI